MNFDDIKDRVVENFQNTWSKIQESSLYILLKERFENLNPQMQKIISIGGGVCIFLFILSIPYTYYTDSTNYVGEFEEKRELIRELLKVSRDGKSTSLPRSLSASSLSARASSIIDNARLGPDQIQDNKTLGKGQIRSKLILPPLEKEGVSIRLAKLNLKQIVDIGYRLQSIDRNIKVKDMIIEPNREDPRYSNVEWTLVSVSLPPPPPEPKKKKKKSRRRKKNK